ncbi:hypothetical protein [Loktanella sp. R86503]|uniref:hypothetical protein n=1 Tax=Loktanella sp. R86503 TaxID=3093847 RepID=UPI0036DB2C47
MVADTLSRKNARIRSELQAKLGLKGRTLEQQAGKVGRSLPRAVIRDLRAVVRADVAQGNPKLARMADTAATGKCADRVLAYLGGIDRGAMRQTRILRKLAAWSALGILVFTIAIWVLRAQGRI